MNIKRLLSRPELIAIMMVNFIGTFGIALVIPFLVVVVYNLGGNAVIYGLVMATYPFFQLVGAPLLGKWSDEIGRRPVLLLSQAGTVFSWMVFLGALLLPITVLTQVDMPLLGAFAITIPLLVVIAARALDGLTGGNISVAQAYLGDITNPENRSKDFGYFQVASTVGFALGPAMGGVLGETSLGNKLPIIAAIIISLVGLWFIYKWLPEPKRRRERDASKPKPKLREVFSIPGIPAVIGVYFTLFVGFNLMYTAFPVAAINDFGWSVSQMGLYFTCLSILLAIMQGPVLAKISPLVDKMNLIRWGTLSLTLFFVLISTSVSWLVWLAIVFFAMGNGMMWPSLLALLSERAGDDKQGSVMGVSQSGGSLASIIGLLAGGVIYSFLGTMTFLLSAAIFIGVFAVSWWLE